MGNEMASGEPSYGMAIMSGRRSGKMQKLVDKLHGRCEELATERDNILDRYNHSVSENANLRSRCEKLNATCIELATDYAKAAAERDESRQWAGRLWQDRDDWRFRYNDLRRQFISYDGMEYKLADAEAERDEARQWARKFRAKSRGLEGDRDLWRSLCSGADEDIADLRAQLAEARSKAGVAEDWAALQFDLADKWHNENNEIRRQLAATEIELDATAMELDDTKADLAEERNKALDEALRVMDAEMRLLRLGYYDIRQVSNAVRALKDAS